MLSSLGLASSPGSVVVAGCTGPTGTDGHRGTGRRDGGDVPGTAGTRRRDADAASARAGTGNEIVIITGSAGAGGTTGSAAASDRQRRRDGSAGSGSAGGAGSAGTTGSAASGSAGATGTGGRRWRAAARRPIRSPYTSGYTPDPTIRDTAMTHGHAA